MIEQRDIVLLKFPFSNLQTTKVRPAIVISNNDYNLKNEDIVVCAITSNLSYSEYKTFITLEELERGILPTACAVRADKPYSVLKNKIQKIQARLNEEKFKNVIDKIQLLISKK